MKKKMVLAMLLITLATGATVQAAAFANGPSWDNTINALGRSLTNEVGNYNIAAFNANPDSLVFDFEDAGGTYPTGGDQVSGIILHSSMGSPIDKRIIFDVVSPYGRIMDGGTANAHATSGVWSMTSLARNMSEVTIRFAEALNAANVSPVYGVGFMINRTVADSAVTLYDASDAVITTVTLPENNTGTTFSFFGYYGDTPIAKVGIDTSLTGGSQFWMDDFAIINNPIPEPATMVLLGLGALALIKRKK